MFSVLGALSKWSIPIDPIEETSFRGVPLGKPNCVGCMVPKHTTVYSFKNKCG